MYLQKNITSFVVSNDDSIRAALEKIERNKSKLVYVVDEHNRLIGAFADGDFRRWAMTQTLPDVDSAVGNVANRHCVSLSFAAEYSEIEAQLKKGAASIPLLDEQGHILAIALTGKRFIEISGKRISEEDPSFLIAEIGNNHQGNLSVAKKMCDLANQAGVDCIKFQMRDMSKLYGQQSHSSRDLGAQYTYDLLEKFQLSDDELFEVFNYCKKIGTIALCTPWDLNSLARLEQYGMPAYKIASADFTNFELLGAAAETGKPLICSTGMSTESEIIETVDFLQRKKAQFILLHCNSTYPAPFKDVNLKYMERLKELGKTIVGYSGHERGWAVPVAAVSMGAKVIEKHFTLDRDQEGNDHKVSLLPEELAKMVKDIRSVEEAMGKGEVRQLTQGELINREVLAKSLYAKKALKVGDEILPEHVQVMSPGTGLQPNRLHELVGKICRRDIAPGEAFFETDIKGAVEKKASYSFNRPYGIPVRFHDFDALKKDVRLDFVEFHLSYSDLELPYREFVSPQPEMGYAVHAPELFAGDHLLDLASFDDEYRAHSIRQLQAVVDLTSEMNDLFPKTNNPVIVLNAGGWKVDGFWSELDKKRKYALVKDSLAQINSRQTRLAIQTMPPFPWHFGGQSHHSLFVRAAEIVAFAQDTGVGVCLDLSHSMMACNYYSESIYDFTRMVAPYALHLHIVDAKGVDGEGVQIGHGDVNFDRVCALLDELAPGVQFIPEVWQGHTNEGQGFWEALSFLEQKFK